MHFLILLILAVASFGAASDVELDMPAREWHAVTIEGHDGVVIPRQEARELMGDNQQGIWLPSEERLAEAERAMRGVAKVDHRGETVRPELDGYRQYLGFIEDGDRKIAINSFCTEISSWRSQYVMVMDGGNCFWGAVYNVDTGEVEGVRINGDA